MLQSQHVQGLEKSQERAITKANKKNEGSKVWKAVVKGWDESIRLSIEYKMNFSIN